MSIADEDAKSKKALADALVDVHMDSIAWVRISQAITFGADAGIPTEKMTKQLPQDSLKTLPLPVLEALKQGSSAIPAWAACVDDRRSTGIRQNDRFNGQVSEESPLLTCEDAALTVLSLMVPSQKVGRLQGENAQHQFCDIATEWGAHVEDLSPGDKFKERLKFAGRREKVFLLGSVYQTGLAEAYPIIESYYLERAKAPDDLFFLEVDAFFRHRRKGAAEFLKQLDSTLPKNLEVRGISDEQMTSFKESWRLVTRYDNIDSAIDAWNAGSCSDRDLSGWIDVSVDMPWGGHSMAVEPVELHVPVMENNFISLVSSAHLQQDFRKRVFLLQLASRARSMMKDIREHSQLRHNPVEGITSDRWKPTSDILRELLEDSREVVLDYGPVTSPAVESAKIIWEGWGPDSHRPTDSNVQPIHDWRQDAMREFQSDMALVILPAARDLVAHPDAFSPESFPVDEQPKLYRDVFFGTAIEIRNKIRDLPWRSKLLAVNQIRRDAEFLASINSQFLEFVDRRDQGSSVDMKSFDLIWKENIQGHSLGEQQWEAMKAWVRNEAQARKYWVISGTSSLSNPGITLHIRPARENAVREVVIMEARISLASQPERYLVLPDSAKPISLEQWNELYEEPRLRRPAIGDYQKELPLSVAAIKKIGEKDEESKMIGFDGLYFEIGVIPVPADKARSE